MTLSLRLAGTRQITGIFLITPSEERWVRRGVLGQLKPSELYLLGSRYENSVICLSSIVLQFFYSYALRGVLWSDSD